MDSTETNRRFIVEYKSIFDGKARTYRINLSDVNQSERESETHKVQAILNETQDTIAEILENTLADHNAIQATLNLEGAIDEYDYKILNFHATNVLSSVDLKSNVQQYLEKAKAKILWKFQDYDSFNKGSKHFFYLRLNTHKVAIEDCIIDVASNDDMSFKWAVLAALHPGKTIGELKLFSEDLVMDGIEYPVQLDDMPRIEEKNKFSINVYMLRYSFKSESDEIEGPVYHTKKRQKLHINLLLSNENGKRRYSYLKDLGSATQLFCEGCLSFFKNKFSFEVHQKEECLKVKTTISQPSTIEFRNPENSEFVPFVVYTHFETLQSQVFDYVGQECHNKVWRRKTHKDLPYSYGYYIKCVDENLSKARINIWEQDLHECVPNFTNNLVKDLKQLWSQYKRTHPEASLKYVPILMRNLKKNGNHLIRESYCDSFLIRMKNYLTVHKKLNIGDGANKVYIRFLEFRNFINEKSLYDVINNMKEEGFKEMQGLVIDMRDVGILTEKEIKFPRYFVKFYEHLKETSLPTGYDMYNNIDNELYNHAQKVWSYFGCENVGKYLKVYIKSNLFFLANVIEKLRLFCKKNYGLDPAHYYSTAGFGWDAMLKYTNMKLELLSDVEMLTFIKKGIRGGYVQCNKRHAAANNRYLLESFNHEKDESYIVFLDANNLYGHAMRQPLPYGGFEWVDVNVNYRVPEDSAIGYILEVDLSYPLDLHDKHSDFPFCPEKKNVYGADNEFLVADFYPKQRYVIHHSYLALCVKNGLRVEKIHRILKFKQSPWLKDYIDFNTRGRQMAKNKCDQNLFKLLNNSVYGKTIENLENRSNIQLLHNWENIGYKKEALSSIGRPDFYSYTICSDKAIALTFEKTKLTFKQPIYVGFSILDLAKTHMYKFHYEFMKKELGDNLTLLYTDTDSLIYEFRNVDCYKFIQKHVKETPQIPGLGFDTSGYKKKNEFGIPQKNNKIGYFKDELNGAIVKEFVGIKAKTFLIVHKNDNGDLTTVKKAVHVPRDVKNEIQVEEYKDCIFNNQPLYKEYSQVRTVDYDVYKQSIKRMVLSPHDPKRYILPDRIHTLPWGHHKIRQTEGRKEGLTSYSEYPKRRKL